MYTDFFIQRKKRLLFKNTNMSENIWQFTITVTFLLIPWMGLFHFGITQHIRSNEISEFIHLFIVELFYFHYDL